jgi:hypothetical protein
MDIERKKFSVELVDGFVKPYPSACDSDPHQRLSLAVCHCFQVVKDFIGISSAFMKEKAREQFALV